MEENRPSDEEILRYERMLKEQDHSPLVSNLLDFSALEAEYYDGLPIYKSKIRYLQSSCLNMRTVKKDGNCFYRAFAFRFCELLRQNYGLPLYDELLKRARESKLILQAMSYDMSILEDFWEPFEQVLTHCDEDNLLEGFCTEHVSDTIVCYLRLVTAALLKRDSEIYEAFVLDSFPSLEMFVSSCVEPMGVESDQIHIVAMANVFGVEIKIANLDTTAAETINYHEISAMEPLLMDNVPLVCLLYRPGHYDILYPK